jgi:hypothetical protein
VCRQRPLGRVRPEVRGDRLSTPHHSSIIAAAEPVDRQCIDHTHSESATVSNATLPIFVEMNLCETSYTAVQMRELVSFQKYRFHIMRPWNLCGRMAALNRSTERGM